MRCSRKKTSYFYENAGSEIHPIFKIKSVHEWDPHVLSLIKLKYKNTESTSKIIWETMEKVFFRVFSDFGLRLWIIILFHMWEETLYLQKHLWFYSATWYAIVMWTLSTSSQELIIISYGVGTTIHVYRNDHRVRLHPCHHTYDRHCWASF